MRKQNKKATYVSLSPQRFLKILHTEKAVANKAKRVIQCPYCDWKSIYVYEDASGHVRSKCRNCGKEVVVRLDASD